MPRKTHKQMTQEKKPLFHVRKVTKPDDLLDRQLLQLKKELIDNLNKKGNDE